MKITVFTASKEMIEVDVDKELELGKLNDLCKSRLGIPLSDRCDLNWRGRALTNPRKSLEDYGFMDGDYIDIFYDEGTARKISDEKNTSIKIIITFSDEIIELNVSKELELGKLNGLCKSRFGILPDKFVFKMHERILTDPKMCLKDYGITDGDILHILVDAEKTMMLSSEEKIMKLIITASGQKIELNVSDTLELENLKVICECSFGSSFSDKCVFMLHERKLTDPKMCLKDYGITDGDILHILDDAEKTKMLSSEEKIMKLIITASGQKIELEVSDTLELENLKVICECSFGNSFSDKCVFKLHERKLTDPKMCLKDYGITDGDILHILDDAEKTMMLSSEEKIMKLIITASGQKIELNVSDTLELENLKVICECSFGSSFSDKCVFKLHERKLTDPKMCLKDYGITDGDILHILDDAEKTMMLSSEEKIMKLIITASGQKIELEVSDTLELENLKVICECSFGNSFSDKCVFKLHERKLTNPKMCLKDYGIVDGDILQILSDEEMIIKKITIITTLGQVIKLDVSRELELENLKAIFENRFGIPLTDKCVVKLHKRKLTDTKMSLKDYGIMDGDILEIIYDEEETIKITVITAFEEIIDLNVIKGLKLENLKALCEVKLELPPSEKCFFKWQNKILWNPKKSLKEYGITDGDILQIGFDEDNTASNIWIKAGLVPDLSAETDLDFGNITVPMANSLSVERSQAAAPDDPVTHDTPHLEDPERIRQLLLDYPDERAILKERNPPLSDALESGSAERFAEVYNRQQRERYDRELEKLRILNADQSDPEVVASKKELERVKKFEENMEVAVEFVPESLCAVTMMYIDCKVNNHPVQAFVDTGAQMTIMNRPCAVRCEIFDLVDFRWAGIAVGVGTQRILGRIHKVDIEINSAVFPSSFSILEDQPVEMILGLDFIKRNMCTIDLSRNILQIKKANGEVVETPFLFEFELPRSARLTVPN
ncbi:hypothetical protein ACJMK2_007955 [Sinanodonta woodiana]|uniref:Ubiquitin-like domain-containing protein n=1 Tax=Sinanodonta woodiana TaxID=1069815 RepID=A0ABD3VL05_SINWO